MNHRLTIAAAMALATLGVSSNAWSVAAPPCVPAAVMPRAKAVPANLPAFGYTALQATASDIHLFSLGNGRTEVPLTVGPNENGWRKVVPASALVVGGSYELDFQSFCSYGPIPEKGPLTFTVKAASPIPTKLGDLQGAPQVTVKNFGTEQIAITATYALADEMKPWADVYELGLDFDGRTIETHTTLTADTVQVRALGWCDESNAKTNTHTIQLRARLPFTPVVDAAPAQATFACPAPSFSTPGAPNPTKPSGAGTSGGGATPGTYIPGKSGGCSVGAASAPSSALFAALGLGLVAVVRRRTSRSR
jgi:MYXO-CTERM domain-containing protein